jgi:RNA polymerase sigma factor (sigma-70 family)
MTQTSDPDQLDVRPRCAPTDPTPGAGLTTLDDAIYPDWDAAYLDNVGRLHRVMYDKVRNRPDAEDLTSEVFRKALGPLRLTAPKSEVRAYLLATARTVLASHWRRRFVQEVARDESHADLNSLAAPVPDPDAGPLARQILSALPDHYRRVLELRYLEGCSIEESARALAITVNNTKGLHHRALRMAARVARQVDR